VWAWCKPGINSWLRAEPTRPENPKTPTPRNHPTHVSLSLSFSLSLYIYIYREGGVGLRGLGKIGGVPGGPGVKKSQKGGSEKGSEITRKPEKWVFPQTPKEPHPRKTPPLKRLTMKKWVTKDNPPFLTKSTLFGGFFDRFPTPRKPLFWTPRKFPDPQKSDPPKSGNLGNLGNLGKRSKNHPR